MSYKPVTVYAIACDDSGCDTTYQYLSSDDDEMYELHLMAPSIPVVMRKVLAEEDWLIGIHHLCPTHARDAADAAVERLEIESTHEPLF